MPGSSAGVEKIIGLGPPSGGGAAERLRAGPPDLRHRQRHYEGESRGNPSVPEKGNWHAIRRWRAAELQQQSQAHADCGGAQPERDDPSGEPDETASELRQLLRLSGWISVSRQRRQGAAGSSKPRNAPRSLRFLPWLAPRRSGDDRLTDSKGHPVLQTGLIAVFHELAKYR